ncbi:glycosyltransferase [Arthrobacter sp. AD-310]
MTGKRLNNRMLGIGLDSLLLALRTLHPKIRGPYLANNPWIAAALRVTGRKNFAVTGIYAEPDSRSWKVLQKLIGKASVITLSESEADAWNADGGHAQAVLYGNTFGYPPKAASEMFHIFVGGSSDRDQALIDALEGEVLASADAVRLTLAVGGEDGIKQALGNIVYRPGYIDQDRFGALLSSASVVFLPLRSGIRAAGHMVLVGALECGVPVMISPTEGVREYLQGSAVSAVDVRKPLLPQLQALAADARNSETELRRLWEEKFSLEAYTKRVSSVLSE